MANGNNTTPSFSNGLSKPEGFAFANFDKEPIVSVAEYRKLTGDLTSTDADILQRIQYLASLSRNIIRQELKDYDH